MTAAIIWLMAFVAFVLVELHTLELTCLGLALGCLLAATGAWLGVAVSLQILIAIGGGLLGVAVIAPHVRKRMLPADPRTGMDLLVGAEAVVIEAIAPPSEGKIRLDGVTWQAVSNQPIPEGTYIYVTEVLGNKLTVIPRGELSAPRQAPALAPPEQIARPEGQRETP